MNHNLQLAITISTLLLSCPPASAGPLRDAAKAVENAAGYVGESVGDTASKMGESIKDTAQQITGTHDPKLIRREVDTVAAQTLNNVIAKNKGAKALFDIAYGYAVFDSRKASFLITTGKGIGVAIRKNSGERTYMHVATAGVNIGAGVQFYQGLFLFENKHAFDTFVNHGWQADAAASATIGKNSLDAQAKFTDGMAYYQLTDTGITLDANITGTKYWKSAELNSLS